MSNIAISIKNLGKSYQITHRGRDVIRYRKFGDALIDIAKRIIPFTRKKIPHETKETFWALDDISFDVRQGEQIGIIGRNGAGKSTLLKIASRITSPTRGSIEIAGRVSSLLEVGTGFHPELTGRENIFLNGAVLGMSRADIRRRFDAIVDFAEVEKFLDTPVKHYSSGMYMRLAFSVAAHLEPDILIVDEVLAVGDAAFQRKCLGKMKEVGGQGRTVLFVSHNMGAITEFCSRAIMLERGTIKADGTPAQVIPLYAGIGRGNSAGVFSFKDSGGPCHIDRVLLSNIHDQPSVDFELSEPISIKIEYEVRELLTELQFAITLNKDGIDLFQTFDTDDDHEILPTIPGRYFATYTIPEKTLKEGTYSLRITAGTPTELMRDISGEITFEVASHTLSLLKKSYRTDRQGIIISPGHWKQK
ncbi:MAG: ABC transporter ATP-binding protein [Bordetella sp.]|uniref:ABC transporter ATP-binding protein n=1 Tax=Bordetella sp. TaxID=28081 RepID=UPI003F7B7062